MGLDMPLCYDLTANDQNISEIIRERLTQIRVTLESNHTSDELFIELSDTNAAAPLKTPSTGAVLSLSLGYVEDLTHQGDFVVSGVERSGGTEQVNLLGITARAAPYTGAPNGSKEFQTQKTRSWYKHTTLGAMVQKMAAEHGMGAGVSPALAGIHLQHLDQTAESDISFLQRLARQYDAIAKPAGGKLLFVSRGESLSASGKVIPPLYVWPYDVISWRWTEDRHITPGTVVATYHANSHAKTYSVSIGSGDPVRELKRKFRNSEDALAAAKAEMGRRARGSVTLRLEMRGNAKIAPGMTLELSKMFGPDIEGNWIVTTVHHDLSPWQGFITNVDCERPNDSPDVKKYLSGPVAKTTLGKA